MADKAISDLTPATTVGASDLFVLEQNSTAKKLQGSTLLTFLGALWESYGGITDTTQYYAVSDSDSVVPSTWYTTRQSMTAVNRFLWSYMTVTYASGDTQDSTPCVIGVWGDQGNSWYVHIKYASTYPTSDEDMGDTPDAWVGVYSGIASTAPTTYTSYQWYRWKGLTGDTGTSITGVAKTGTSGLVDTYTVSFSDGTTATFTVTNGTNIQSIAKTGSSGLQDTYTVTLTSGQTTQFLVNNGKGITAVTWTSTTSPSGTPHIAGATDTYTITYNDGDTSQFQVYNGANGAGAVAKVDGIDAIGDDVPLLTIGNGAPTTATQGSLKSRYFDATNSVLYICLGYDSQSGTYTWQGAGVTVDSALSTSSTNPVQNKIITGKMGTGALNTTAQNLSDAVNELDAEIGDVSQMTTTATDLAAAVNELDSDISDINDEIGSTALPTTAQTLTGAIAEIHTDIGNDVLYLTSVPCSATTGNFVSYSNAQITADHVVAECVFANPSAITTDVAWTTASGSITLNGTCSSATTCNLVLVKKDN